MAVRSGAAPCGSVPGSAFAGIPVTPGASYEIHDRFDVSVRMCDLNQQLLAECLAYGDHRLQRREKTVNLLPLPAGPFTVPDQQRQSGAYATVKVDKNGYSVPSRYVGLKVQVQMEIDRIDLFNDGQKLATLLGFREQPYIIW
jgi:hypothetical protein